MLIERDVRSECVCLRLFQNKFKPTYYILKN